MATENRISTDIDGTGLSQYKRYVSNVLRGLILVLAAGMWVGFWGLVVRLHIQLGDFVAAGVVTVLIVLPAIGGLVYYLRLKLPIP